MTFTHTGNITKLYSDIIDALKTASEELYKRCDKPFKQLPGWNNYCKVAHSEARSAYLMWRNSGKPKVGYLFSQMKRTRAYFKLVIRKCKRNRDIVAANNLANKLLMKNDKSFWKEVKKINGGNNVTIANSIDGINGTENIANYWKTHFSNILNSSQDIKHKSYVLEECNNIDKLYFDRINAGEVSAAIKQIKNGKSSGIDELYGEHFKFAHSKLYVLIALVLNAMIIHNFLPQMFMDTILVPLIKDKKGVFNSSDNYRPLAITCVASKIFELILLDRYNDYFMTSGNQFGFKQYHSTEMCIFTLKYIIEYYRNLDSAMYICFLDASKAFDKVNHWNLFYKLLNRNVPCIVVRILLCWYTTQLFYVNWDHTLSEPFNVTNGVRQGGILSPILFNVFMDDLSVLLNKEYIGCYLQGVPYNHLFYADDSVLLAPSPSALQKLINICDAYATDVELTYNTKKTVCMSILPKWLKVNNGFQFELSGNTLSYTNEHKYLGVYIRNDCMDGSDIQQQVRSIYARGNIIIAKFSNCDVNVKTRLFKTFCNSFYGAIIFGLYFIHTRLRNFTVRTIEFFLSMLVIEQLPLRQCWIIILTLLLLFIGN